ncbi:MAG: hypothetical protein AB1571_01010 [Nanoarchaeota archaeon]
MKQKSVKKYVAGGLAALMLNSCSVPIKYTTTGPKVFVETIPVEEKIESYKNRAYQGYDISKVDFNSQNGSLDILIKKNSYEQKIAVGNKIIEDKYQINKVIKEKEIAPFLWGIPLLGLGIYFQIDIAKQEKEYPEEDYTGTTLFNMLLFLIPGTVLTLVGLLLKPKELYSDPSFSYENRRPDKSFEKVVDEKIIKTEYEPVEILIEASSLSLNKQKGLLRTITNKDGTTRVKLKSLDENVFLTEKEFKSSLKIVKDLEFLGEKELIKELRSKLWDIDYNISISTESSKQDINNDKKIISIKGHKINLE